MLSNDSLLNGCIEYNEMPSVFGGIWWRVVQEQETGLGYEDFNGYEFPQNPKVVALEFPSF